ncbi:hypothetical protein PHMEG_0008747 [Phytophthora megakarya]|uniref:Uncharacterized protein n=1 Tax=Phytophthora megakarya TaxID=4795 RepID=A0A225WHX9_9STRA|nr:hypothetical protein PHMEG_0008747 [Phytophthora megakarya]
MDDEGAGNVDRVGSGFALIVKSHWLTDCPTATIVQCEEALRKYREEKKHRSTILRSVPTLPV